MRNIFYKDLVPSFVMEYMADGIMVIDNLGVITYLNPAAERILEVDREDILNNKYCELFIAKEQNDDFNQTVIDSIYEKTLIHQKIVRYYQVNKEKALFLTTSFIFSQDEESTESLGIVMLFSDITELNELRDAAKVMERMRLLNKEIEKLSYTDDLTGIPNRRCFMESAVTQWQHAWENKKTLSIILIDVDFFKQINDTYGHPAGDECLMTIANVLDSLVCRPGEIVARYGGDEFIALIPGVDLKVLENLSKQMLFAIKKLNIANEASPYRIVTISIGASIVQVPNNITFDALLQIADNALYYVKDTGRNNLKIVQI